MGARGTDVARESAAVVILRARGDIPRSRGSCWAPELCWSRSWPCPGCGMRSGSVRCLRTGGWSRWQPAHARPHAKFW